MGRGIDWRNSLVIYRDWMNKWYNYDLCQRPDWFNKAFLVREHYTGTELALQETRVPSFYDDKNKEFRIDELLKADKEYFENYQPDIIHFFGWNSKNYSEMNWAEYSADAAYSLVGGSKHFRSMINELQSKYNIPVSLYTIGVMACEGTNIVKKLGDEATIILSSGKPAIYEDLKYRYMCFGSQQWIDFHVRDLVEMQKKTGASAVYCDVFPLTSSNTCWSKDHNHEIPLWPDKASCTFLSTLRKSLPRDVAVWSEYTCTDVISQYINGVIAYYHMKQGRHFAERYDEPCYNPGVSANLNLSMYRFVLPQIKQFCLTHWGSDDRASEFKIPFFMGEGEYVGAWWMHNSRTRELLKKGLSIRKLYADCFTSSQPEPMVDTERSFICANKFPGRKRTVWTLFNRRCTTYTGPVLKVDHVKGSTYYDLWNDRVLIPEFHDGKAILSLTLNPQGLGCILQKLTIEKITDRN